MNLKLKHTSINPDPRENLDSPYFIIGTNDSH